MHFFHQFWPLCAAFLFAMAGVAHPDPVISEFMADNTSTIKDEDNAYSDWIEIHNPTATPIDLTDWRLTDSADLDQWRFPAVTLAPGEFLIVWASANDRRVPGQPLHTNFSLKSTGEYLALVRPDGTIQQEFAPEFPRQDPNESYGLNFSGTPLVVQGASARYLIPGNGSAGTTWTETGFDHNTWATGNTGLGFGLLVPGIGVRSVKKNTAYGGLASIAETDALLALAPGSPQLLVDVTVVAQTVNYLGEGGDGHYAGNQSFPCGGPDYHCIKATGTVQIPTAGPWTFGVNSDDGGRVKIDGANVMVDDSNHGPVDHLGTVTLTAGNHTFEVIMWEQAGGDEVEFYAAPGSFGAWNTTFKLVGDTANGGLAAFTFPSGSGGSGVIATNIEAPMRNVNGSAYVRVPFTANNVSGFNSLTLKMRYNDGFIAYLNGVEIARRNAPGTALFNSVATGARTNDQSLAIEAINATAYLPQLLNGSNVLAIHGLNISATDDSFLALPELIAGGLLGGEPAFYDKPTPGSINGTPSSLGKVADTQFSVGRGFYAAPFGLTISTTTTDAQIRYTTDGSTPTATAGTIYTGPITINSTKVIRAAAFKAGWEPTNVDTQTYLFLDDVIAQSPNGEVPPGFIPTGVNGQTMNYGMDPAIVNSGDPNVGGAQVIKNALVAIPTISLVTDSPNLFNAATGIYVNPNGRGFGWERPCSIELMNDVAGGFQVDCGIRVRGGYSRSGDNPKHAFHVYFREDYGTRKLKYPLFGREGVEEFDQIDIRTAQNYSWSFGGDSNNTFLREEFTRAAQGQMGDPYARCRYYHLYINGQYWGLYNTDERTEAAFGASYLGGDKEDYDVVKCEQANGYTTGLTDGNFAAWQDLWTKGRAHSASPTNANYFQMMGRAADGVTKTADPVLLDVDNLVDYMLITFWTGNLDGATSAFLGNNTANNWFGLRQRNGTRGFSFLVHDFEHTLFNTGEDRTGPYTGVNDNNFSYSNPMFLHQDLSGNLEYRIRFGDRVHKHLFNGGVLSPPRAQALINSLAATVDTVITAESARWGDSKVEPPLTRLNWLNARNYILNSYIPVRGNIVLNQLRADRLYPNVDAPTMNQFGGFISSSTEVIMSGPGTIYYTLDGSDPRLLGGGINPNAQTYVSATSTETLVPLGANWKYLDNGSNQGAAWRAPGFNDTTWSSANAELGYGDNDETRVEDNPTPGYNAADTNRYATTYFRKTFTANNVGGITALTVRLKYDDGAIIYINGNSAVRTSNMSPDPAYNQFTNGGATTPDENAFFDFPVSPSFLVEGNNTIAVEIHQATAASSDISFNLQLNATRTQTPTPLFLAASGEKRLRARSWNGSEWSALDDALFLVDTVPASNANLAITEVMYHPSDPTAAEIAAGFNSSGMFEYVELTNTSSTPVDSGGLYFGAGIDFDFKNSLLSRVLAPGAHLLIVANKAAFEFRYGTGKLIAGEFKDSLDNAGETLTLFAANGVNLRSFTYDDLAPWPTEGDGAGYSLVLRRANLDPTLAASWRASAALGGNPGTSDALNYAAWKNANAVTVDNADDDGDGLINWHEYALGGSVTATDSSRLPRAGSASLMVGGITQVYGTLTFTRRVGADDVDYVVESSSALTTWDPNGAVLVSTTRNADGTETCVCRSVQPIPGTGREFLRLRTSLTP